MVSCLLKKIFNDNSRQSLVKVIPLHIKIKRRIHDNLGHKEHSTHSPHPHSVFLNLLQILTTPPTVHATLLKRTASKLADVKKKGRKLYWKKYICSTVVYFDLLNSTLNNYHALDRLFYVLRILYFFLFLPMALRILFRSMLPLSGSFKISLRHIKFGRTPLEE
jgi:hypothetical protein